MEMNHLPTIKFQRICLVSGTVHAFNGFPNLLWRMLWFFPQLNALVSLKNKNK